MENASKALLIAGGVLIAMVTIALLVSSFSSINKFQMSKLSAEEQERLIAFNEQYTKYAGQYVYGTDVITIINASLNQPIYPITVKIKFIGGYTYNGYTYNPTTKRYDKTEVFINKRRNYNNRK